jgi:hypothetical protein
MLETTARLRPNLTCLEEDLLQSNCRGAFRTGSKAADPTTVSTVPDSIAVENPKNFGKRRPYLGR